MLRIDTSNGKFDELSQEIYVSNKWLNDVQNEIISVIEKEGIVLDGSKSDQLNDAINKKIAKLSVSGSNNSSDFIVSKDIPSTIRGVKSEDPTRTISREKPNGKWLSCSREFNYNDSPELNMFFNLSFDALKDGSIPSKKHMDVKFKSIANEIKTISDKVNGVKDFTENINTISEEILEMKKQIALILDSNSLLLDAEKKRKGLDKSLEKNNKDLADKLEKQRLEQLEKERIAKEEAKKRDEAEAARLAELQRKLDETKRQNEENERKQRQNEENQRKQRERASEELRKKDESEKFNLHRLYKLVKMGYKFDLIDQDGGHHTLLDIKTVEEDGNISTDADYILDFYAWGNRDLRRTPSVDSNDNLWGSVKFVKMIETRSPNGKSSIDIGYEVINKKNPKKTVWKYNPDGSIDTGIDFANAKPAPRPFFNG